MMVNDQLSAHLAYRKKYKYFQKEQEFMQFLYHDVSEEEMRSVFKIISKMENNLKKTGESL